MQVSFFVLVSLCVYYWKPEVFDRVSLRKLVLLFLAILFFGASVSKLKDSGLMWMDGEVLRFTLLKRNIFNNNPLSFMIAHSLSLCSFLSILALLFQATFPLCVFIERLEKLYIILTIGFIIFVFTVLNINLDFLAACLLIYLPWTNISLILKEHLPRSLKHNFNALE